MAGKADQAIKIWANAIKSYSPDEIKRGVLACEDRDKPPSLGEFKKLCRPPKPKQNAAAYENFRLPNLHELRAASIPAKAEMRLINIIQRQKIQDFDDETELKMDEYYKNRRPRKDDHPAVTEFLSIYRGQQNQQRTG